MKRVSKLLSLILRHRPEVINLTLDEQGWASVKELIDGLKKHKQMNLSLSQLQKVVETNDKQRFSFSEDLQKIRANQGHSLKLDLDYPTKIPPTILYHGTAQRNIESILKTGLDKRNRHHVHLSDNPETATQVGKRYGKPILLKIDTAQMHKDGITFMLSANGVWLVEKVLPKYIGFVGSHNETKAPLPE